MPFIKATILHHFDSKKYIQIEIDAFGYAICEIFSQPTLDQNFSGHVISENPNFF